MCQINIVLYFSLISFFNSNKMYAVHFKYPSLAHPQYPNSECCVLDVNIYKQEDFREYYIFHY